MKSNNKLTNQSGTVVGDNQNSITAGPHGPSLMENVWLMEKLAHFNRERIPERVVHAKGSGAYGTFTVTKDISQYTKASLFSKIGKKTDIFMRFSVVAGERGAADTVRDVRGFAIKFYTEEGNWDIAGNNTPVFFIRDAVKFPDFIHTQKRDPQTNYHISTHQWDFWSLSPESLHQVMILMSDRGIPQNYRQMHGFGSHTFSFINSKNERFWVKFHFITMQGIANYTTEEASQKVSKDLDYSQRDLFENIQKGNYPKWKMCVQIMPESEASTYKYNPFDLTKVWSHKDYPLIEVGIVELNKNPENYYAEVEQSAFDPGNIIPGIGFSPDKVLQGRLFAYADAQRYRLGVNYESLPVNAPKQQGNNYQRDGKMRFDNNGGSDINYEPNSFKGPQEDRSVLAPPLPIEGDAYYYSHRTDTDYYSQPGALFRLIPDGEKKRLITNIANSLKEVPVPKNIQIRTIARFYQADENCGKGIAEQCGIKTEEIMEEVKKQIQIDQQTNTNQNIDSININRNIDSNLDLYENTNEFKRGKKQKTNPKCKAPDKKKK